MHEVQLFIDILQAVQLELQIEQLLEMFAK